MRHIQNTPNYRVYDRTGSGVTQDIYAESLEDAIAAGREWIEDGDWTKTTYRQTLDCGVREIAHRAPHAELSGSEDTRVRDLLALECAPESLSGVTYDDMDREQLDTLADYLDSPDDSVSDDDQEMDSCIAEQIRDELVKDDEDITDDQDESDCSGTLEPEDAPDCIEGHNHEWVSPYSVMGGCKENPGVWGSGHGQIKINSVCKHCGLYRTHDYGDTNPSDGTQVESTSYSDPDESSLAYVRSKIREDLPEEIEIDGVTVTSEWDEADLSSDDPEVGRAVHTVPSTELDDGTAGGPSDGHKETINGNVYEWGVHDTETDDGQVTCTALLTLIRSNP